MQVLRDPTSIRLSSASDARLSTGVHLPNACRDSCPSTFLAYIVSVPRRSCYCVSARRLTLSLSQPSDDVHLLLFAALSLSADCVTVTVL